MLPQSPAHLALLARMFRCLLLVLAVLSAPLAAQPATAGADTEPVDQSVIPTEPVVVDGVPLFHVRGISSYPASYRASVIADRIRAVARNPAVELDDIQLEEAERDTRIAARDQQIMSVLDADGEVDGIERQVLAEVFLAKIRQAVDAFRAKRTRASLLDAVWRAAAASALTAVILFVVSRIFRRVRRRVEQSHREPVGAVSTKSFEMMREGRVWSLVDGIIRLIGVVALLVVLYAYLGYALALFPWTYGIATHLGMWVMAPIRQLAKGFVAILPNLFFLVIVFLLARWVLRLIRIFFAAAARGESAAKHFYPEWAEPTYKLVRLLVIALAIVVAYPYIPGSNSLAFKGISVFLGIVASMGSSSAIANIIAGYILIYRRVFHEGDVIRIGEVYGRVTKVRLQVTQVRTPKNEEIIVPNSTIVSSDVINYSSLAATDGIILHTTVGIGYDTPWQQVEAMLLEAAARTPDIRAEPKPFVLQLELGDFAVTHQINVYCDTARTMAATRAALHRNILDVFNEYGVQIMTPAYEGDTERPKIVPPEGWYPAPAVKTPTAADADGAKSGAAATQSATGGAQVAAAGASPAIEPGSAQR